MSKALPLLLLWIWTATAQAQACELGSVCWTDLSGGEATTELKFRAAGGERTAVIEPGVSTFRFVELLRASPLLPSDWLCVQGRQRNVAGASSDWFISEREGVCNQTAAVLPAPVVEPPPEPVPPPMEPDTPAPGPPEPSIEIFSGLTNSNGLLSFFYTVLDCPRGVQQTTSAEKHGQKRITLRCRR